MAKVKSKPAQVPLVFISHDSRDGKIAEAVATLLKRVCSDRIQVFRSSDRGGKEGIRSADVWFETVRRKMKIGSEMVCILTTRSIDRSWIFWEAGFMAGQSKPVHGLAIGLSLEKACVGPFAHFQNCRDDSSGLHGLINSILSHIGIPPNEFLISNAIEKFLNEKENVLSETDPPSVDKYLRPDPEVSATLKKLGCRSIEYSGWNRRDMVLPEIVEQRDLPSEFLDYEGNDARCEHGSQERYSLRSIKEPLCDEGTVRIRTVLARSRYADVFRLSRLLDKPFVEKEGLLVSGRNIYGYSWYPLEKSPLVHNVNMQPIVITKDKKVVLVKRSKKVHYYPGCWTASIEEQMNGKGSKVSKPDLTYFDCAERGVREELACTPNPEDTKILSVGIEYGNLSASFICIVRVEETFRELCEKWLSKSKDPYEASAIDAVELKRNYLQKILRNRKYEPSKNVFARKEAGTYKWHPTARMRLFALIRHLYEE
jgi:hypothetical protein